MPSSYAHYRFGCQLLRRLPQSVLSVIKPYRSLYDFGLHGPDPFFYYNPAKPNKIGKLGSSLHRLSGVDFFGRCVRKLKMDPSPAAESYLYGVLAHYCLDSTCHPSIVKWTEEGIAGHSEIETEFDRYLLEHDGRVPPHAQDVSPHMRITRQESKIVAPFYTPATPEEVYRSSLNMTRITHLLSLPDGPGRKFVSAAANALGSVPRQMVMPDKPNPCCTDLDPVLLSLYDQALDACPGMVQQLQAMISGNTPLGKEFVPPFG